MKKRWIAIILLVALVLSVIPVSPANAVAGADLETSIQSRVNEAVEAYAASVYHNYSSAKAFLDFFYYATLRGENEMVLSKDSPVVSALFNSGLFQQCLKNGIRAAIVASQDMGEDTILLRGSTNWHNYGYSYHNYLYAGTEVDGSKLIGANTSTSLFGKTYNGPKNSNDDALELMAGGIMTRVIVRRVEVNAQEAVYDVRVDIRDKFNFNELGAYDSAGSKGANVTKDKILNYAGLILSKVFLNNFYWEFQDSFQVRVPYQCDHTAGNYQWSYDKTDGQMRNVVGDGYLANDTTKLEYVNATNGAVSNYYKLDEPVVLEHDRPWVVEYEFKKAGSFVLAPFASNSGTSYPALYQYSIYNTWMYNIEYVYPDGYGEQLDKDNWDDYDENSTDGKTQYTNHYAGIDTKGAYKYSTKYTYTYRLENVVAEDGSNMIWVSVYNNDLDQIVMESRPMDMRWTMSKGEKTRTLKEESGSTHISGKDIHVNYIGNKTARINNDALKVTIFTNGEGAESRSTITTRYQAPSCTKEGGNIHQCSECGYSYMTEVEPATGHAYGEYTYDHNETCLTNGTETAVCATCGWKDSRTVSGTALGHVPAVLEPVAPKCDVSGLGEGSYCTRCNVVLEVQPTIQAPGHDWKAATCTSKQTCQVCGLQVGGLGKHRPVTIPGQAATCAEPGWTEEKVCGDCGKILEAKTFIAPSWEHNYQAADCESAQHCVSCGATSGDPLGHAEQVTAGYAATCNEPGLTDGVVCATCGKILSQQQVIEKLGHEWQLSEDGQNCSCLRCGEVEQMNHEHVPVALPGTLATCTELGLTDGTVCAECGVVLEPQTQTSAKGHTWQAATCQTPETCADCGAERGTVSDHKAQSVLGYEATCQKDGLSDGEVCADCGHVLTQQQAIPATGHNYQPATCEKAETCADCGATQGEPAGHSWAVQEAKAPTCSATGLTKGETCSVCGAVGAVQQTVPATGEHFDDNGNGCCDSCGLTLYSTTSEEEPEEDAEEAVVGENTEAKAEENTQNEAEENDEVTNSVLAAPNNALNDTEMPVEEEAHMEIVEDAVLLTTGIAEKNQVNILPGVLVAIAVAVVALVGVLVVKKLRNS